MPPAAAPVTAKPTVAAAMVVNVKISRSDTTVGQLRNLFRDEHVHAAVIVEDGVLVAVIDRVDLLGQGGVAEAVTLGCLGSRVIGRDVDLDQARSFMVKAGRRRLAVVDAAGRFHGLLCLKRTWMGFCSDQDVFARARS